MCSAAGSINCEWGTVNVEILWAHTGFIRDSCDKTRVLNWRKFRIDVSKIVFVLIGGFGNRFIEYWGDVARCEVVCMATIIEFSEIFFVLIGEFGNPFIEY